MNRIYAGRVVISLNERERDRENPFHFSVLEMRGGEAGKQEEKGRKRILFETNQGHHFTCDLQPNLQVSLFPRDLNDSRGRKELFRENVVRFPFERRFASVSYLQRKLKTSNGRILIPNVAASSLFLTSRHEDVYGNVSLHLT